MKVAVWNQSCTYGIFTLLPILLFILVTLWKMKAAHDNEMTQIRWELDKAKEELNKSTYLHSDTEEELKQRKDKMTKMTAERRKLENKTGMLQDAIKLVEDKVLNLTSKLLLKEVEAGIEKEENRRLLEAIEDLKKKATNEQTKNDLIKTELEGSSEDSPELGEKRRLKTNTELTLPKTKSFLTQTKSSTDKALYQSELETNKQKANKKDDEKDDKKEDQKDDRKDNQKDDQKDDKNYDKKDDQKVDQKDDQRDDQKDDQKDDKKDDPNYDQKDDPKYDKKYDQKDQKKNDDKYSLKDDKKNDDKDNQIHDQKDDTNNQKDNEKDDTNTQKDNEKDDNKEHKKDYQKDENKEDLKYDQEDVHKDVHKDDQKDDKKDEQKDHKKEDDKNNQNDNHLSNGEDDQKDIVDRIMEIKQKQQELDVAKEELFSNINSTDTSENKNVEMEENKISIDVEIRNNSPDKKEETNMPKKNINILNPTYEKETNDIIGSESLTDRSATIEDLMKTFPKVLSSPEFLVKKDLSTETPGNSSDEIVSKIIEIKQKEQELNHAKDSLFSDSNKMNEDNKSKHNIGVKENGENYKMENISNAVANNSESKSVENKNEKKIHIILDVNDQTDKKQPVLENSHNNNNNLE